MQILEHMLEAGENTAFIVVMLTNYFVSLLKLHELQKKGLSAREQASELKVNPYFLRDFEGALERYDRREVERSFSLLAEADEQIKGGVGHPKQVMQALLIRLQSVEEPAHEAYL